MLSKTKKMHATQTFQYFEMKGTFSDDKLKFIRLDKP